MNGGPSVIVNKGGFLASLAKGVFGTVMVLLVCGTALGLYGMHVFNSDVHLFTGQVGDIVQGVLARLPDLQKALPPILADACNDRRAIDYRDSVQLTARLERARQGGRDGVVVLEVKNNGKEAISLLTARVVVQDESDSPVCELSIVVATPLQIEDEWRGPLQPGETRIVPRRLTEVVGEVKVSTEVTDLRVFNPPVAVSPKSGIENPASS
jgi:hypothetical protein